MTDSDMQACLDPSQPTISIYYCHFSQKKPSRPLLIDRSMRMPLERQWGQIKTTQVSISGGNDVDF